MLTYNAYMVRPDQLQSGSDNNNNNNQDGAVIMAKPLREFTRFI